MSREPFILVEQPLSGDFLRVDGPEADHLVRVLRARPGSRIIAFNGMGSGWRAEVVAIKGFTVECRILEPLAEEPASGLRLQVGVGIVKGQRMDWAVEKASETGADMFMPIITERSMVKPGGGKIERWRGIALAAAKQSRRLWIMEISEPILLSKFINTVSKSDVESNEIVRSKSHTVWAMHYGPESRPLIDLYKTMQLPSSLTVIIGPEGGFSDEEIGSFKEHRIPLVGMGRKQLRTETAVAVAIGMLSNLFSSR